MRFTPILVLFNAVVAFVGCNRNRGETPKGTAVIIFRGVDGRTLTMEDLRGVTGTFRYEVVGSNDVPAAAQTLHQQARSDAIRPRITGMKFRT